jgi:hypothetical protein
MRNDGEVYVMRYPCLTRSAEDTLPSLIEALEDALAALKELQQVGGWVSAVGREADCGGREVYNYNLCSTDPEVAEACGMEKAEDVESIAADCGSELLAEAQDLDLDPRVAAFPQRPAVARPVAG